MHGQTAIFLLLTQLYVLYLGCEHEELLSEVILCKLVLLPYLQQELFLIMVDQRCTPRNFNVGDLNGGEVTLDQV